MGEHAKPWTGEERVVDVLWSVPYAPRTGAHLSRHASDTELFRNGMARLALEEGDGE